MLQSLKPTDISDGFSTTWQEINNSVPKDLFSPDILLHLFELTENSKFRTITDLFFRKQVSGLIQVSYL